MSEEMKRRLEKAQKKILEKTEIIRLSRLSLRSAFGFGIPIRDRLVEKQGQFMGQLQKRRQQNQQGIPAPPRTREGGQPNIQERFSNRPLFQFFQSQEPQQPAEEELNEDERLIIDEHRRQLLEEAQIRLREKAEEEKRRKDAESLRQAKLKMSVNTN